MKLTLCGLAVRAALRLRHWPQYEGTHMSPVVFVQAGGSLPTVDRLRAQTRRRRGKR